MAMSILRKISFNALAVLAVTVWLPGCVAVAPFPTSAHPGDTVALPLGDFSRLRRSNVSVDIKTLIPGCTGTITKCTQVFATLPAGDSAIRALINLYPDPVSNLVVGDATGQNIVGQESMWGGDIDALSDHDKDWAQTLLLFDLPSTITDSWIAVDVRDGGSIIDSDRGITILPGAGAPDPFDAIGVGPLTPSHLGALERSAHYTVSFSGPTVPYAIQVSMNHAPDLNADPMLGVGKSYVVGTRGDIKTTHWQDDGTNLKVILIPSNGATLGRLEPLQFYVAGGIQNLQLNTVGGVEAFDINGNPVSGISAIITPGF